MSQPYVDIEPRICLPSLILHNMVLSRVFGSMIWFQPNMSQSFMFGGTCKVMSMSC